MFYNCFDEKSAATRAKKTSSANILGGAIKNEMFWTYN